MSAPAIPNVVITLISVGSHSKGYCTVALLSSTQHQATKRISRLASNARTKNANVIACAARAVAAVKHPATIHVVTNDRRAYDILRGERLAPKEAQTAYHEYFRAAKQHCVTPLYARGERMGKAGKTAYQAATNILNNQLSRTA